MLEHIFDIVDLITVDYEKSINKELDEKDEISKGGFLHLTLLALFHDVGKIIPLMQKYNIGMEASHEMRSFSFTNMFAESYKDDENLKVQIERFVGNMKKLSENKKDSKIIKRFSRYDEKSREIEASRVKKRL